jgi:hypothetical protein
MATAVAVLALLLAAGCSPDDQADEEQWPAAGPLTVQPSDRLDEEVSYSVLPAPPVVRGEGPGACTAEINPNRTGCIQSERSALGSVGTYWADNKHMFVGVIYAGAPAAGPGSEFSGKQVLLVKLDGTTFENGDPWKCLTCGLPAPTETAMSTASFEYPLNGFRDGRRLLAGTNILDCGAFSFADEECTPDKVNVYPLHWDTGKAESGALREPRLHPDDEHIGFSHFDPAAFGQFGFMGRLELDQAQRRYNIVDSKMLFNPAPAYQPVIIEDNRFELNSAGMIGEFRGWTADGKEAIGIAQYESGNVDAIATDLVSGRSRPLTSHAGYTDPLMTSPAGKYMLALNTMGSGRLDFLSGAPGIPPIVDQLPLAGYVSGMRNNSERRFFLPYLVDTDTQKSQQLSYDNDQNWNASADPAWLSDGTGAVWAEQLVQAPACGGENPLPCPPTPPGQPNSRVIVAKFNGFTATDPIKAQPATIVEWGLDYKPGQPMPARPSVPAGTFTKNGAEGGTARITVTNNDKGSRTMAISVIFDEYTDDGELVINGPQSVAIHQDSPLSDITWKADLTISGPYEGTVKTSADGFTVDRQTKRDNIMRATGTMTTTINGHTYHQPINGG